MRGSAVLAVILLLAGAPASPGRHVADPAAPGPGVLGEGALDDAASLYLSAHYENADPTGFSGAGPAAVTHRPSGVATSPPADPPSPRVFTTAGYPLEPSLAVRSDGSLVTIMNVVREHQAPAPGIPTVRTGVGPAVLLSRDGGVTWDAIHQLHVATQDPMVHVDPATDRIFTADFLGCIVVGLSEDAERWTETTSCGWNVDHQTLASAPPRTSATIGAPTVTYMCAIGGGLASNTGTMIACTKSLDGGLTWTPTGEPAFQFTPAQAAALPGPHCYAGSGPVATIPDGRLLVPRGHCGQPWLAMSDDEGATWQRVQVAESGVQEIPGLEGHDAAVAGDAAGNLYYFWIAADWLPYYAVSRDAGATWSSPRSIAAPGVRAAALPAMAIGDGDSLAFTYMGTRDARGDDAWWHAYVTITEDALSDDPLLLSTTLNDPVDPLIRGECGPLRCQQAYDFLDVEIAPDGRPWIVFTDACDLQGPYGCDGLALRGRVGTLVGGPPLRAP